MRVWKWESSWTEPGLSADTFWVGSLANWKQKARVEERHLGEMEEILFIKVHFLNARRLLGQVSEVAQREELVTLCILYGWNMWHLFVLTYILTLVPALQLGDSICSSLRQCQIRFCVAWFFSVLEAQFKAMWRESRFGRKGLLLTQEDGFGC